MPHGIEKGSKQVKLNARAIVIFTIVFCAFLVLSCNRKSHKNVEFQPPPHTANSNTKDLFLEFKSHFSEHVYLVIKDISDQYGVWISRLTKVTPDAEVSSYIEYRNISDDLKSGTSFAVDANAIVGIAQRNDKKLVALGLQKVDAVFNELNLFLIDPSVGIESKLKFADINFTEPKEKKCIYRSIERGFHGYNPVQIATYQDKTILLTYYCQYYRLTVFDSNLKVIWSRDITNQRTDVLGMYGEAFLKISDSGIIAIGVYFPAIDMPQYNEKFRTTLVSSGDFDILVTTYDINGTLLASQIVGTENLDLPKSLVIHGDSMYIVGRSIVNRPTSVRNFQNDMYIAALQFPSLKLNWEKLVDIQDEDSPESAIIVDDKFLLVGGSTGFLQVNTGSIIKHGDVFVTAFSLDGQEVGRNIFGTLRDDSVSTIVDMGNGKIVIGGVKDAAITHDGDNDRNQTHQFGFLDFISWKQHLNVQ